MNFRSLSKQIHHAVVDNAPLILTAAGVVGIGATGVFAVRAGFKSAAAIDIESNKTVSAEPVKGVSIGGQVAEPLTAKEKAKLTWQFYVPAVLTGTLSCGAVILSHRITAKQITTLAGALAVSERAYAEHKEKAHKFLGDKKNQEMHDEIAQDRVNRDLEDRGEALQYVEGTGKVWLHDEYTGRFFLSTVNDIDAAVNLVNARLSSEDTQTVSDFYDIIGLAHVSTSDEFGWQASEPLQLSWSTTKTTDGKIPAHSFEFATRPMFRPWNSHGVGGSFR